jgi:hypothetical protein
MTDAELKSEILRIAKEMGFQFDIYEIRTIEQLARAARLSGRQDILNIIQEELANDLANSASLETVFTPFYKRILRKSEALFGYTAITISELEHQLKEDHSVFPPWLDKNSG